MEETEGTGKIHNEETEPTKDERSVHFFFVRLR